MTVLRLALPPVLGALAALAACSPPATITVVTVEARPAVREVEALELVFSNDNATLSQSFAIGGRAFPLTFTIETPDRTGALEMTARGLDRDGELVGLGAAAAAIVPDGEAAATLVLEPADFLVNTDFDGAQRLAWVGAAGGLQVAAGPDGGFTIGFSDDCGALARCDVFGRRYDATAVPQVTETEASDAQFTINVTDILGYDPSMATNADGTTLAAWTTLQEIVAVAITPDGATPQLAETVVSTGTASEPPAVAALPDGRFVVAWVETDPTSMQQAVKARLLSSAGALATNPGGSIDPFTVSTAGGLVPSQVAVAASGNGLELAFAWRAGASLRARFTNASGLVVAAQEIALADFNIADTVWSPRVAPTADGKFVVAWARRPAGGALADGAISVRKVTPPLGTALSVDATIATGLDDAQTGFGLSHDDQGALAVAWYTCSGGGDGAGCGVRARLFRDSGLPVGEPFTVNTTTTGNQFEPSIAGLGAGAWVVAFTDDSGLGDPSLTGIRARVIYPPFLDATGVIGARCGGAEGATCGDGTVCLAGGDGELRCHAACDPAGAQPHCPGGGVCTTAGDVSGCVL